MEVLMSGSKMRLNEKNVVNFATCNSPVDKEGWLLKKAPDASSGHGRGFQKRYFTLKGNLLFYFDKKGDKEPLGVIIMEGCTVELVEVPDQAYTFGIHFQGQGSRTYIMAADDQEVMESWMKVLSCATYEYMRLMVAELQRQLDEINAAERAKARQLKEAARTQQQQQPQPQQQHQKPGGTKTVSSSRTESSHSMISSSENGGLEEDDFFAASPSSFSSASSISCHTPPPTMTAQQQQQRQKNSRLSGEADVAKLSPTSATGNGGRTTSVLGGAGLTSTTPTTTSSAALRRAPSPSRLNPVGATVVQDISDVRSSSPSRVGGGEAGGRGSPSLSGDVVISDMHIVDRRSTVSPSATTGTTAIIASPPKSFIDLHEQFGQAIVQQIQSRKSSSSAMSSASSEEYY